MTTEWETVEDSHDRLPAEWIAQCEYREAQWIEGDNDPDDAHLHLHVGVIPEDEITGSWTVCITRSGSITGETSRIDGGTDSGVDIYVDVPCRQIRDLLGRPRVS